MPVVVIVVVVVGILQKTENVKACFDVVLIDLMMRVRRSVVGR
jgi:hypothetical protein